MGRNMAGHILVSIPQQYHVFSERLLPGAESKTTIIDHGRTESSFLQLFHLNPQSHHTRQSHKKGRGKLPGLVVIAKGTWLAPVFEHVVRIEVLRVAGAAAGGDFEAVEHAPATAPASAGRTDRPDGEVDLSPLA